VTLFPERDKNDLKYSLNEKKRLELKKWGASQCAPPASSHYEIDVFYVN